MALKQLTAEQTYALLVLGLNIPEEVVNRKFISEGLDGYELSHYYHTQMKWQGRGLDPDLAKACANA